MSHDAIALRRALLAWYRAHARPMPWRDEPTPYRVWISEVMLQQTQVETVIPYFERWLARLPTIESLAAAPIDEVLALWSGLGYYRRAHNLQRTARELVERHGGTLPADHDALLALPGVGRYTAGAIASIAFGLPYPVVDGNVVRVVARLAEVEGDPTRAAVQRRIWAIARELVDVDAPGDFNQALMELGSVVCRPRNPDCAHCPVQSHCAAYAGGRQDELPSPKRRRHRHREVGAALLVRLEHPQGTRPARYLLAKRRAELLSGLWCLPWFALLRIDARERSTPPQDEIPGGLYLGAQTRERVAQLAREVLGPELAPAPGALRPLKPVEHGFTHIEYTLVPWLCVVRAAHEPAISLDAQIWSQPRFVEPAELAGLGVPRMIERVFEQL